MEKEIHQDRGSSVNNAHPSILLSPEYRGRTRYRSPHPRLYKQRIQDDSRDRTFVRFTMLDHVEETTNTSPDPSSDSDIESSMQSDITRFKLYGENKRLKQEIDQLRASQGRSAKYDQSTSFQLKTKAMADGKFVLIPQKCTFHHADHLFCSRPIQYPRHAH